MNVEPVYLVLGGELMIDAPVEQVWHHVLNYPSWQNYSSVEHISGEPGGEGEVVLLRKEEEGFTFPPYYARTIKLEPRRRSMWKTYPETRTQGNDFFGIVEFRLEESQGTTRFSYNTLYEFLVPHVEKSELDAFRERQRENFETLLAAIFPKLKALAEQKRAAGR